MTFVSLFREASVDLSTPNHVHDRKSVGKKIQGHFTVRLLLIIQHSIAVYGPILGMVFLFFTTNCHLSSSYEDSCVRYLLVPFYR